MDADGDPTSPTYQQCHKGPFHFTLSFPHLTPPNNVKAVCYSPIVDHISRTFAPAPLYNQYVCEGPLYQ